MNASPGLKWEQALARPSLPSLNKTLDMSLGSI